MLWDIVLLFKGLAENIVAKLYVSETEIDDLEKMIPGVSKSINNLKNWIV